MTTAVYGKCTLAMTTVAKHMMTSAEEGGGRGRIMTHSQWVEGANLHARRMQATMFSVT
jgi:hypothetical protein